MTTKNKLDKMFGPAGSWAGILLFVAGLIITWFSFTGLILVAIGAFVGFTTTSTSVDFDKKRLRFSTNIFGILPSGPWISIKTGMKFGIKKSNKIWRTYSQSNQTLDIASNDYRIVLLGYDGIEIMPIQKSNNPDAAKLYLDKLSKELGIGVI